MIINTVVLPDGNTQSIEQRERSYQWAVIKRRTADNLDETSVAAESRRQTLEARREHYDIIKGPGWTDAELARLEQTETNRLTLSDWCVDKWCNDSQSAVARATDLRRQGWEVEYLNVESEGTPETTLEEAKALEKNKVREAMKVKLLEIQEEMDAVNLVSEATAEEI